MAVMGDLCAEYLCDEAQQWGEPGGCTCPCHDMEPELVPDFARGLRGELPPLQPTPPPRRWRRPARHPAEVTAARLADTIVRWGDQLTAEEILAIGRIRRRLLELAQSRRTAEGGHR